jgi:hypothetical protein
MSYYLTHNGLFITKAKGLRVFRERVAIYCDNHTNCMDQSPSWDLVLAQLVKKFCKLNATRRFSTMFTQPDIYPYRIHFFPSYSFDIQFSVVVSTPWSSGLPFWFYSPPPKKKPYMHFSSPPVRATCHVRLIFHDWSSEYCLVRNGNHEAHRCAVFSSSPLDLLLPSLTQVSFFFSTLFSNT